MNLPSRTKARVKQGIASLFASPFGLTRSAKETASKAGDYVMPRSELIKQNEALRLENEQLKLQLQVSELGDFEQHVQATSEYGTVAKANIRTKVEGSAELVMEIQDLDDPVEIGHETVYEVRVSNKGSKAAEKVGLTFELPSGLRLINVQSATEHMAKSGLILFNDLPQLAPGKTALGAHLARRDKLVCPGRRSFQAGGMI